MFIEIQTISQYEKEKQNWTLIFSLTFFAFSIILLRNFPSLFYSIHQFQFKFKLKFNGKTNSSNFEYPHTLSFVAIVKNEGPYIKEWIEYHKIVGVTKFYIYDNDSKDNISEILKPYIKSGEVTYTYFPGHPVQIKAYNDCVQKYKNQTQYMGFIDIDEFVVPIQKNNLIEPIEELMNAKKNIAGVGINWLIYGSNGFQSKPRGLVIENYRKRSNFDQHIKTICDPRKIKEVVSPHSASFIRPFYAVNENGKKIKKGSPFNRKCRYKKLRINHYHTKSLEEYKAKIKRGRATTNETRDLTMFYHVFMNSKVYDYNLEKYVPQLKKILNITDNFDDDSISLQT